MKKDILKKITVMGCAIICTGITMFITTPKKQAKAEEMQNYEYAIFSPTVWTVFNSETKEYEDKGIQGTITITFNGYNAQFWYKEKITENKNFQYIGTQIANITNETDTGNDETLYHFRTIDTLTKAYIHIYVQQKNNLITENGILRTKTNQLQDSPTTYEYLSSLCAVYLSDETKIVLLVDENPIPFTATPGGGPFTSRKRNISNPYLFNHITLQNADITGAYEQGLKDGTKDKEAFGIKEYNRGKAEGTESANKYTFTTLMLSIVDVPVQTLYGLLNFEILGYNMLSFVMGLLSLAIVIWVIRKLTGSGGEK